MKKLKEFLFLSDKGYKDFKKSYCCLYDNKSSLNATVLCYSNVI